MSNPAAANPGAQAKHEKQQEEPQFSCPNLRSNRNLSVAGFPLSD
jgi:hypothetical protein